MVKASAASERVVPSRLVACLRDLDPPAGGAEMSLATLLAGIAVAGPLAADAPEYEPCVRDEVVSEDRMRSAWHVDVMQSGDRGEATALTIDRRIHREVSALSVEGFLSGAAWRLRSRRTQRPNKALQRLHLKRRNRAFRRWLTPKLVAAKRSADEAGGAILGVTQLDWSAGAAAAFADVGIPWLAFVRDELQFQHQDIYRESIEGAAAVCGAGLGLLEQVGERFAVKRAAHVPLPVDFGGRFGSLEGIVKAREDGRAARGGATDLDMPRIAIVGVTPEKGAAFYPRLLQALAADWPEARVDVHGGGAHAEALGRFPNATWHGHTPVEQVFVSCDVHLLTVQSTGSWGRVINEAGLFGVPSVSIDIGSQGEAVGSGGAILPAGAGVDAWVEVLRNTYNDREALGESARSHAGVIDHRRSIAMFRSLIEDVVTG